MEGFLWFTFMILTYGSGCSGFHTLFGLAIETAMLITIIPWIGRETWKQ
jgi:hypothetical protein